jgi:hypothetical protein
MTSKLTGYVKSMEFVIFLQIPRTASVLVPGRLLL